MSARGQLGLVGAPQDARQLDLPEAARVDAAVGGHVRLGVGPEDDLGHGARRVGDDDGQVALARATREAAVVGLLPAGRDRDAVVAQARPEGLPAGLGVARRRSRWSPAGRPGRARRWPGSRRRAGLPGPGRAGPRGCRARAAPRSCEGRAVDVEADVAVVDGRDAVLRVQDELGRHVHPGPASRYGSKMSAASARERNVLSTP